MIPQNPRTPYRVDPYDSAYPQGRAPRASLGDDYQNNRTLLPDSLKASYTWEE